MTLCLYLCVIDVKTGVILLGFGIYVTPFQITSNAKEVTIEVLTGVFRTIMCTFK